MIEYSGLPLTGFTALVTGAGRRTGRAIALAYARAGADVVVNTASNAEAAATVVSEIEAMGRRGFAAVADVSSADAVRAMITDARAEVGPITILVCNAATRSATNLRDMTHDQWHRAIDTILHGTFYCIQSVIEDMVAARFGRIIGISGDGSHAAVSAHAHVSAAKFGVEGLIRSLATEVGRYGVTANIVSPAGLARESSDEGAAKPEFRERIQAVLDATPIGRLTKMEEIADLCVYLSLPQSGYLTSQTIHAGGGFYSGY